MAGQMQEMERHLQERMQQNQAEQAAQLHSMQATLQQLTQWRSATDTKLTAYDVTLKEHATLHTHAQTQVRDVVARLDSLEPRV